MRRAPGGHPPFIRRGYVGLMAKKRARIEALEAWDEAEQKYRKVIAPYLPSGDKEPEKLTTEAAVAITRARTKADHRMESCLNRRFD